MKYIIFTLLSFLSAYNLCAQSADDPKVTYSQEECQLTTSEFQRFICYVTRANVEEKTLLKIGVRPNSFVPFSNDNRNSQLGLNLEIMAEHKVHPSFSILAGVDYNVLYTRLKAYGTPDWDFSQQISAKIGTRYYYGMARRIREGKSANNFSGNYIGLQASRPVSNYYKGRHFDFQTSKFINTKHVSRLFELDQPALDLLWGFQRRLGRLGYVDINAGPRLTRYSGRYNGPLYNATYRVSFQFNALIGLGW
ncbi:hypothetical protein [Larkinella terrae]|uniref:DUF3575 domain-containing protein n=1 Tax=Larkinella terrae TaxID=2025311 RepID=A0A7K0EI85_9BACT|nr:hypothetical protein [Larkinella terrae]MRS61527.1 hypothetical protein [Larkinella terrae]